MEAKTPFTPCVQVCPVAKRDTQATVKSRKIVLCHWTVSINGKASVMYTHHQSSVVPYSLPDDLTNEAAMRKERSQLKLD